MDVIGDLKRDVDNWRKIAVYLADCHAATAEYDGMLSNTSKSRRERFMSICNTAAISLKCGCLVGQRESDLEKVVNRCEKVIDMLKEK